MLSARIVRGLKANLASRVVRVIARGGLILVLTRFFLTTEEYGLLFFAISVFGVAELFATLGLAKSGARYLSQYSEKDSSQIPHILRTVLKYRLVLGGVVGVVFTLFGGQIAALLGEPEIGPLLGLGLVYIVFGSVMTFTTLSFQGLNRVVWSSVVTTVGSVGEFLFVVTFVLLGWGIFGALLGFVAGAALASLVGLAVLYTKCYATHERSEPVEAGLRRRIRRYSVPLTATKGANVLDKQIDTVLLGILANPVAVGYYTLGKQVSDFVITPASSLGFTIAPTYGRSKESGDLEQAGRVYETTFEYVLLLYIPAAVGLALVAEPMIRHVFGADYLGAVVVVQIFSGFIVLQAVDKITNDALDFLGRSRERAYSKGFSAAANFGLNLVLIPPYGVVGASVATVFTYGLMVSVNLYIIHSELPLRPRHLAGIGGRVVAVSAAMGLVVGIALPYVSGLVTLLGTVLVGVLVWSVLSVLVGVLDLEQVQSVFA